MKAAISNFLAKQLHQKNLLLFGRAFSSGFKNIKDLTPPIEPIDVGDRPIPFYLQDHSNKNNRYAERAELQKAINAGNVLKVRKILQNKTIKEFLLDTRSDIYEGYFQVKVGNSFFTGVTALIQAVLANKIEVIDELVFQGADINATCRGQTVLNIVITNHHLISLPTIKFLAEIPSLSVESSLRVLVMNQLINMPLEDALQGYDKLAELIKIKNLQEIFKSIMPIVAKESNSDFKSEELFNFIARRLDIDYISHYPGLKTNLVTLIEKYAAESCKELVKSIMGKDVYELSTLAIGYKRDVKVRYFLPPHNCAGSLFSAKPNEIVDVEIYPDKKSTHRVVSVVKKIPKDLIENTTTEIFDEEDSLVDFNDSLQPKSFVDRLQQSRLEKLTTSQSVDKKT